MPHIAESHIGDREFGGRSVGIPEEITATPVPLAVAAVARTAEGTTHVNTLVVAPFAVELTSPSLDLPARGPCVEDGTSRKTRLREQDGVNDLRETFAMGTYPRNVTFPSRNIFRMTAGPKMPPIPVVAAWTGFTPGEVFWRLRVRHVLGRHFSTGNYHYATVCRPLELEWRGTSAAPSFTLFADNADDPVTYDSRFNDRHETVMGGYGLLSIAAYPPGEDHPVVAHAHLRIRGTNPGPDEVKVFLAQLLEGRNENILLMMQAAFVHESGLHQFSDQEQCRSRFTVTKKRHLQILKKELGGNPTDTDQPDCELQFAFPYDPPGFPLATFDFGVGISQYTQLRGQTITEAIAWNWKENMKMGVNLMFKKLRAGFPSPEAVEKAAKAAAKAAAKGNGPTKALATAPTSWIDWVMRGWKRYNGVKGYADRLRQTPEGQRIATPGPFPKRHAAIMELVPVPIRVIKKATAKWPG